MSEVRDVVLAGESIRREDRTKIPKRRITFIMLVVIVLSLSIGFTLSNILNSKVISRQEFQLQTSGTVSISESELIEVAKEHSSPIYWSGPIPGYSYILTVDERGSSILRYMPNSDGAQSSLDSKREIATYISDQAWQKSLVAANKAGLSNFRNGDGSLVFYATNNASDVFMAFEDVDVQVEIFDSRAGHALSLALLEGEIRPVYLHEDK